MHRLKPTSLIAGGVLVILLSAGGALAFDSTSGGSGDTPPTVESSTGSHALVPGGGEETVPPTTGSSIKGSVKPDDEQGSEGKLAGGKLNACRNREHAINNILSRIAIRGQKQLDLFTTIATRVENFYTQSGKTLSNYDALVADVTAKKAAAQTALDTIKADSVSFKCDGTDPKGAAQSFKDALNAEIAALKAYKTSIKNLIVGVKSVQGTTSSSSSTSDSTTTGGTTTGGSQ